MLVTISDEDNILVVRVKRVRSCARKGFCQICKHSDAHKATRWIYNDAPVAERRFLLLLSSFPFQFFCSCSCFVLLLLLLYFVLLLLLLLLLLCWDGYFFFEFQLILLVFFYFGTVISQSILYEYCSHLQFRWTWSSIYIYKIKVKIKIKMKSHLVPVHQNTFQPLGHEIWFLIFILN